MKRKAIAWGFLSGGFFGASALAFTCDLSAGVGAAALAGAAWSFYVALFEALEVGGSGE